jgi:general secretion pathway protein E
LNKTIIDYILSQYVIISNIHQLSHKVLEHLYNDTSIQEFFDKLFLFAIDKRCSDIHFEVFKNKFLVKFRIDGLLKLYFSFHQELYQAVSSVIKVYANLDISQKRLPQNGRFHKEYNGKNYDFRVSTIPIIDGESIVLRILDKSKLDISLDSVGFNLQILTKIKKYIDRNIGMVLVTGPTGSGKTTSLYAMIKYLNKKDNKIITIEDPIEYQIDNISQIAVDTDIGLTFEEAIRNILRQDPDVIMIGEIRDKPSLSIAMQAALTGHLVLATLHTNSAISTIDRLVDLEAEKFIISSTVKLILSQRLIKKLCPYCKQKSSTNIGFEKVGCNRCNLTGYYSRIIVNEVLEVDEKVSSMIQKGEDLNKLLESQKHNFIKLFDDGLSKVENGDISYEDFIKHCSF